jgi:uncharacterized protein YdeI (YjbR/CyaY-like superfamily)
MDDVAFFETPATFRAWLEAHHATTRELWVGYYKKGSGQPSITWPESVDEALCFGWIDGLRKSIDDVSYRIRFTPRKPRSTWSAVNVQRVAELTAQGRMHQAGLDVFAQRAEAKTGIYAYEQRQTAELDAASERQFQANEAAWAFFQSQPAGYRKTAIWWVVSAKRDETRRKRLATLIDDAAHGRTIKELTRPGKPEK